MLIFCLVAPHPKKEKVDFKNIILLSRNWNKDRANKMTVQKFIFANMAKTYFMLKFMNIIVQEK